MPAHKKDRNGVLAHIMQLGANGREFSIEEVGPPRLRERRILDEMIDTGEVERTASGTYKLTEFAGTI